MAKALSALDVGATFEVPVKEEYHSFLGTSVVFKLADNNHAGYPTGAITLITDKIIALLSSDAKEPGNSDLDRSKAGNNRHIHSNLLQWLNSTAAEGEWYSAKHEQDTPPIAENITGINDIEAYPYDTLAGFLTMLDDDFVAALMNTTLTVVKNTVTDGGGYDTFSTKMFLASRTEVGLENENDIAEGSKLALFSDIISRIAYCTQACIDHNGGQIDPGQGGLWWLRTPVSSNSSSMRIIAAGVSFYFPAYTSHIGVRPLCNLSSSLFVTEDTNANGNYEFIWNTKPSTPSGISVPSNCYSGQNITVTWGASNDPLGDAVTYVLERSVNNGSYTQVTATTGRTFTELVSKSWNTIKYRVKARGAYNHESSYTTSSACAVIHNLPPVISGQNGDLGAKAAGFAYAYTVTDPNSDTVTVVEKVAGKTLRSYTPTLGDENTLTVAGNDFTALANAAHTLTITATDTAGNSAVRTLTFTKAVNQFVLSLAAPLEAKVQQRRANVLVTRHIPAGGTFKVEATNNPYDMTPAWEDCTSAVLKGVAHVFRNTENTAVQYGINIRVTVERGDAISECWVSSIEGNFE